MKIQAMQAGNTKVPSNTKKVDSIQFEQLIKNEKEIKLSKHAKERLISRDLQLASEDYQEISDAIDDLASKGSRESLLIYKDMGLIANIHNRTIITAMDMNDIQTVTNIDSAKFIK